MNYKWICTKCRKTGETETALAPQDEHEWQLWSLRSRDPVFMREVVQNFDVDALLDKYAKPCQTVLRG